MFFAYYINIKQGSTATTQHLGVLHVWFHPSHPHRSRRSRSRSGFGLRRTHVSERFGSVQRDAYFASNPGSNTFSLTKRGIMSFNFNRDGSAAMYYMGSRKPITVPVQIGATKGNTLCFKKVGKFHGSCLSLFKTPGGYMVDSVFGNGQMRTFKAYGLNG